MAKIYRNIFALMLFFICSSEAMSSGWQRCFEKCYFLSTRVNNSFSDQAGYCRSMAGSKPVDFGDKLEQTLTTELSTCQLVRLDHESFWINRNGKQSANSTHCRTIQFSGNNVQLNQNVSCSSFAHPICEKDKSFCQSSATNNLLAVNVWFNVFAQTPSYKLLSANYSYCEAKHMCEKIMHGKIARDGNFSYMTSLAVALGIVQHKELAIWLDSPDITCPGGHGQGYVIRYNGPVVHIKGKTTSDKEFRVLCERDNSITTTLSTTQIIWSSSTFSTFSTTVPPFSQSTTIPQDRTTVLTTISQSRLKTSSKAYSSLLTTLNHSRPTTIPKAHTTMSTTISQSRPMASPKVDSTLLTTLNHSRPTTIPKARTTVLTTTTTASNTSPKITPTAASTFTTRKKGPATLSSYKTSVRVTPQMNNNFTTTDKTKTLSTLQTSAPFPKSKVSIKPSFIQTTPSAGCSSLVCPSAAKPATTNFETSSLKTLPGTKWVQVGQEEYYVNYVSMNYRSSVRFCREMMNASLVTFINPIRYITVLTQITLQGDTFWVGEYGTENECLSYIAENMTLTTPHCHQAKFSVCSRDLDGNILRFIEDPEFKTLIQEMTVLKNETGKSIRKLTSANDSRPSAKAVGSVGVFIICFVVTTLLLSDCSDVKSNFFNRKKKK